MVPGDMYKWSGGIFAKKTKFHDAGGPGTVVSPKNININLNIYQHAVTSSHRRIYRTFNRIYLYL